MKRIALIGLSIWSMSLHGQTGPDQATEIIYGRKDGMALTMVVQPPAAAPNGKAVIWVVSAGWTSKYNFVSLFKGLTRPFSERGYTLFYVMHGSAELEITRESASGDI
jgi:hypothetical protein